MVFRSSHPMQLNSPLRLRAEGASHASFSAGGRTSRVAASAVDATAFAHSANSILGCCIISSSSSTRTSQQRQPALVLLWQNLLRHAVSCAVAAHPANTGGRMGTQCHWCSRPPSMQKHMACSPQFDVSGSLALAPLCCQALEPQADWPGARQAAPVRRPPAPVAVEVQALLHTLLLAATTQALPAMAKMQCCCWVRGSMCHNLLRLLAQSAQRQVPQASAWTSTEESRRRGAQ